MCLGDRGNGGGGWKCGIFLIENVISVWVEGGQEVNQISEGYNHSH